MPPGAVQLWQPMRNRLAGLRFPTSALGRPTEGSSLSRPTPRRSRDRRDPSGPRGHAAGHKQAICAPPGVPPLSPNQRQIRQIRYVGFTSVNSITASDCGVRWQRPPCRPRSLATRHGHGVGDEPLTRHDWTAPGSGVTDRSQTCVSLRQTPGLTWAFAWQVLDSNQGRLTSTVLQGAGWRH